MEKDFYTVNTCYLSKMFLCVFNKIGSLSCIILFINILHVRKSIYITCIH